MILPCKENNYDPPVKSVSACKKGKTKGVRLILLTSLLDYLESINKTNKKGGWVSHLGHMKINKQAFETSHTKGGYERI